MKTYNVMIMHDNGDEVWNMGEIEAKDEEQAERIAMEAFEEKIYASVNEVEDDNPQPKETAK